MSKELTITAPDDLHLHLRDGEMMQTVLPHSVAQFRRAIVMPNLQPPITTTELALSYRDRILSAVPEGSEFTPMIPLYLTDKTQGDEIRKAHKSGVSTAMKYYPAGATTNSESAVTSFDNITEAIAVMEELGLPLLVHGEVTDPSVDMFDRESRFLDDILEPLRKKFPSLKIVMEHISTKDAVDYVTAANDKLAATITPHHISLNRNALFNGGMNPHHFCFPILKSENNREAVLAAAISGSPKFFLGTDSAPHPRSAKEKTHGSAGLYSAYSALPIYAEIFENAGALDKLEAFASFHGADFYDIPRNTETVTLIKQNFHIPNCFLLEEEQLVPMSAGGKVSWRMK
jgi:dihydroorotase